MKQARSKQEREQLKRKKNTKSLHVQKKRKDPG